jgi:aminoglycoside 6'-N-acetyltransferase
VTTLHGERVTLRPLARSDLARLVEILREPEVARWFGPTSPEDEARAWAEDREVTSFAIVVAEEVVGSIAFYEEADPDHRHAGMDLFLATASQNEGLGTEALRLLARYLLDVRGHHRLIIDPAAANERAIRVYERIGFKPVGILRRHERGPDGTFHDGLLLDLLAEELR